MAKIKIGNNIFTGCNIQEDKKQLIIDGKYVGIENNGKIEIIINGNINSIHLISCNEIVINGNVENFRMTSGNVRINGDVCGSVKLTGGEISCKTIKGDASVVSGKIGCFFKE